MIFMIIMIIMVTMIMVLIIMVIIIRMMKIPNEGCKNENRKPKQYLNIKNDRIITILNTIT